MAALDIQDAYLHVPIASNKKKFLAFTHGSDLYFFRALPFGLSTAPYVFTRLLSYPMEVLRKSGVTILPYLDDLVLWAGTREKLELDIQKTTSLLSELGFRLNWKNSRPFPSQELVWLGVRWLPTPHLCVLSEELIIKIRSRARELQKAQKTTRQSLESFQGLTAFAAQLIPRGKLKAHYIAQIVGQCMNQD